MNPMSKSEASASKVISFLVVMTICFLVAYIGSIGSMRGLEGWYPSLVKPSWNPPNWVFGPVWTVLYAMMGASAWYVWRSDSSNKEVGLTLFGAQLVLNGLWSWLFFGWQRPDVAFWELIVLILSVIATIVVFYRVKKIAAVMLMPYLGWIIFAAALNFQIVQLNK